jgi:HAD domain in Swiss Army Knife RNA repair proteins
MNVQQNPCKPLLLIDVDGVLSLFGPGVDIRSGDHWISVDGIPHLLSEEAGNHLRVLAAEFECVWCTGWEEKADEYLRSIYSLPNTWPHLTFRTPPDGAHWKLEAIEAYVGPDRPVAWIDDSLDARCATWAAARPGPTRLVRTDPARGLTAAEAAELRAWAADLPSGSGAPAG